MQTLKKVIETKKEGLLNIYCTAGYPELNDLPTIVNTLYDAGVDMVEIGIPYSDPIADGETIQQSNAVALRNGITIDLIFEQFDNIIFNLNQVQILVWFGPNVFVNFTIFIIIIGFLKPNYGSLLLIMKTL